MRLLEFFNGFIDLFRSRYTRYLESEVMRLRMENAGLNHTLLSSKGIQQTPTPDLQDLTARGRDLRATGTTGRPAGQMKPVVGRTTHAKLRRQLELADQKQVAEMEQEIRDHREKREERQANAKE